MTTYYDYTARLRLPGLHTIGVYGGLDQSYKPDQSPTWRADCTINGGVRLGRIHWDRAAHTDPPFGIAADWIIARVAAHLGIDPTTIQYIDEPNWTPGN